jgi:hypothetical protein
VGIERISERVVSRLSKATGGETWTRRSFLTRLSIVATAITTRPGDFALRPVSAYDAVCGTLPACGDPFTAFCCTIAGGANVCPEGTFVGGWWKADRSAYCRGAARYYIDCNGTARHPWRCHCSGSHTCDKRKVACNVFRYGNCHLDIANYRTAVVCRVVTCTPPWIWDTSCNETTFVDQVTGSQSAPCLPGPWPSPLLMKWSDLGGSGSVLGPQLGHDHSLPDGDGTWAAFRNGAIYDVKWLGLTAVYEPVWRAVEERIGRDGIGYPSADVVAVDGGRGWSQSFANRAYGHQSVDAEAIGRDGLGTHVLTGPVLAKWRAIGGVDGTLGYPTTDSLPTADGLGLHSSFLKTGRGIRPYRGAIYWHPVLGAHFLRGRIYTFWLAHAGERGPLGLPSSDRRGLGWPHAYKNEFAVLANGEVTSRGVITTTEQFGTHAIYGVIYSRWIATGAQHGPLGVPTSDVALSPDKLGELAAFQPIDGPAGSGGGIATAPSTGAWPLLGGFFTSWLADQNGPRVLGYPLAAEVVAEIGSLSLQSQAFSTGAVYNSDVGAFCVLYGPILTTYLQDGGPTGSLGVPTSSIVVESNGDQVCTFQHGTLTYTPGGGVTRS